MNKEQRKAINELIEKVVEVIKAWRKSEKVKLTSHDIVYITKKLTDALFELFMEDKDEQEEEK